MNISVSSDEHSPLVDFILEELKKRGHRADYFGPAENEEGRDWPDITHEAVRKIADKQADEAIIMCWTGTGATLIANKVPGIRAALCCDEQTARGARTWNHANVLALSLRTTSLPVAGEILDAWFKTPFSDDEWNLKQMKSIDKIEKLYSKEK